MKEIGPIPLPLDYEYFEAKKCYVGDLFYYKREKVVVEHLYIQNKKNYVALFPAYVQLDRDNGDLILQYEVVVHYQPIIRQFIYNKENMPNIYPMNALDLRCQLALALGALMIWDKYGSRNIVAAKGDVTQWFMLWKDEPWYTWSNDDQAYSKIWTRGLTEEDYQKALQRERDEKIKKIIREKNKKK